MRSRNSNAAPFVPILFAAIWTVIPAASAQPRPSLGLHLSGGHATLSLTGAVGTVYAIQYASNVSPTSDWTALTLLQFQEASNVWIDPSPMTPNGGFYRVVSPSAFNKLVFIQPGTFTMGSPTNEAERYPSELEHRVTISRGFWIGKFLVTQGDYLGVTHTNPSYFTPAHGFTNDLTCPVEQVNWYDATDYCVRRTLQERAWGLIPTNYSYRLPTEAEWEYACRAGTTTAFYHGSILRSGQANFDGRLEYDASIGSVDNPNGIYLQKTTSVGAYPPNPWGLYDMIGNVGEWCQDWFNWYTSEDAIDPQGLGYGNGRVFRGGLWYVGGLGCRSATRFASSPLDGLAFNGFRVVLAPSQ